MGSLNHSDIPVPSKNSDTFRNRDGTKIYKTDSRDDTITELAASSEVRAIGSGSIVRGDDSVEYTEDVVWGLYMAGRSSSERVASIDGQTRDLDVELGDNQTDAVIPTGLGGHVPQLAHRHTGNRIVQGRSVDDTVVERVSDTGVYGV